METMTERFMKLDTANKEALHEALTQLEKLDTTLASSFPLLSPQDVEAYRLIRATVQHDPRPLEVPPSGMACSARLGRLEPLL
jgi:hypothetical protein